MTTPRVWVGGSESCHGKWSWCSSGQWVYENERLKMCKGDIFIGVSKATLSLRPRLAPRIDTLQTCKVVDW